MKWYLAAAVALVLCFSDAASAFGNDEEWVSGWGQGMSEAVITYGPGNQIYVACDEANGMVGSSISFSLAGAAPTGSQITMTFDNEDPEPVWVSGGRIPSNCRACAATFDDILEKLKTHDSVHVMFENGNGARFTLNGAAEAIGSCTADFYQ